MDELVGTGIDRGWLCVVPVEERTERKQIIDKGKKGKIPFLPANR